MKANRERKKERKKERKVYRSMRLKHEELGLVLSSNEAAAETREEKERQEQEAEAALP